MVALCCSKETGTGRRNHLSKDTDRKWQSQDRNLYLLDARAPVLTSASRAFLEEAGLGGGGETLAPPS